MEITYHIRRPIQPRGGSQYYRDRSPRTAETCCGAAPTDRDLPFTIRTATFWHDELSGNTYMPCDACLDARFQH